MNCKNCKSELFPNNIFCSECGGKIIKERITVKSLFSNLLVALGWDSNFFFTLRKLLYQPQIVCKEYINGTRKKYANPFTFFTISLALSLFVYNQYSEKFIQFSSDLKLEQAPEKESVKLSKKTQKNQDIEFFGFKNENEFFDNFAEWQLKYNNLISFLLLPLFTLITFLLFRKPYNYGEHLVINTYILSVTTFLGILLFLVSILTEVNLLLYNIYIIFIYYCYVHKKLYELSFWKFILMILMAIVILLFLLVLFTIIGVIPEIIKSKF